MKFKPSVRSALSDLLCYSAARVGIIKLRKTLSISLGGRNIRLSSHQFSRRTKVEATYAEIRSAGTSVEHFRVARESCFIAPAILFARTRRRRSWTMALPSILVNAQKLTALLFTRAQCLPFGDPHQSC